MKRIKAFCYNCTPEMGLILIISIIYFPFIFIIEDITVTTFLCVFYFIVAALYILYLAWNAKKKRNGNYLSCNYSIIKPNCIWINQNIKRKRDKECCPQKEFARELLDLKNNIPQETICYCCTHELIKNHIVKTFENVEVTAAYKKDLRKLKKKLVTKKCKNCTIKCSLLEKDITQFYAIKFIKA